jgi:predicted nuclease with TOPRIM domain
MEIWSQGLSKTSFEPRELEGQNSKLTSEKRQLEEKYQELQNDYDYLKKSNSIISSRFGQAYL